MSAEEKQLWVSVYMAVIASGGDAHDARRAAGSAVDHMREAEVHFADEDDEDES